MEKGKKQNKTSASKEVSKIIYPVNLVVIAELDFGIVIAKIDIKLIREQDINAHLMKPEMFRQLHENIKKRGGLESLPFCALINERVEMISGHHRLRAAKEAGLKEMIILLYVTGLTRSQVAAKQLAHNAINGFDDPSMLKEIAKIITDVDDMIESFIGKEVFGEPLAELDKLLSPMVDFDWKQIQFIFLPHQMEDLQNLVNKTQGTYDYIGIAYVDQYEKLMDMLQKYQNFKNVKNLGAAMHSMIISASKEMDDAGFDDDSDDEWTTVSRLFGAAAIPKSVQDTLKAVFEKMKKNGDITDQTKWKSLEILAKNYLND